MSTYSHDNAGVPYLVVGEATAGMRVRCDGDFTCCEEGAVKTIQQEENGELYIECAEGHHYVTGQVAIDGKYHTGLYKVD